ncbi:MAG: prepilin-type N-terminal cleavage/methylation domain-containing protein [Candidatus Hydrogenedentes bacterium]|nr:prepilin-type N-terminal cleavage/methylation domain-containing protein [Candidatus Hydrogenedentota bacterium]
MAAKRPGDVSPFEGGGPSGPGDVSSRASRAGFTLLEVVIALTILAVGIMAVMALFPASLTQQRVAAERTVIASLARTQLSEVRTGGMGASLSEWIRGNAYRVVDAAARGYTLYDSWRASATRVGGPGVELYRVVFSVRLNNGREEEFVTYVTDR